MSYLYSTGIFLVLVTTVFIFSRKKVEKANWWIILVLLIFIHPLFAHFIAPIIPQSMGQIFFNPSYYLLIGPLILFYSRSFSLYNYSYSNKDLLHFIPFFVFFLIYFYFSIISGMEDSFAFLDNRFNTINLLSIIIYFFFIIKLFRRQESEWQNIFSYENNRSSFPVMPYFSLIILFFIGKEIYFRYSSVPHPFLIPVAIASALFAAILVSSFLLMLKKTRIPELDRKKIPQKNSNAVSFNANVIFQKLQTYIKGKKAYLDPELTLHDISEAMKVPKHQISKAIKVNLNINFFLYINNLRVEEAIRKISPSTEINYSLLTLGRECGFYSKAALLQHFKRVTRMTLNEYRKENS